MGLGPFNSPARQQRGRECQGCMWSECCEAISGFVWGCNALSSLIEWPRQDNGDTYAAADHTHLLASCACQHMRTAMFASHACQYRHTALLARHAYQHMRTKISCPACPLGTQTGLHSHGAKQWKKCAVLYLIPLDRTAAALSLSSWPQRPLSSDSFLRLL